jgi:hypothetical protein
MAKSATVKARPKRAKPSTPEFDSFVERDRQKFSKYAKGGILSPLATINARSHLKFIEEIPNRISVGDLDDLLVTAYCLGAQAQYFKQLPTQEFAKKKQHEEWKRQSRHAETYTGSKAEKKAALANRLKATKGTHDQRLMNAIKLVAKYDEYDIAVSTARNYLRELIDDSAFSWD